MQTYLLIGGAGFIGSHLAEALLKRGNKVIVVDRRNGIDANNAKKVEAVFMKEKPDVVFHLAGAIHLRNPITDPLFKEDLPFLSRLDTVLSACMRTKVKKFVFVSSGGAMYENASIVPTAEEYPVVPSSLYGLANLMMETYIKAYCKIHRMDFTIPRLSNAYGPRQWQSGVMPSFIIKTVKKERPVIFGKGNQTRDFIYIDDAVEALILLAERGKNEVYNVGSSQEVSLKKLFTLVSNLLGATVKPVYEKPRFFEVSRSALDISKIKNELGWSPKVDIKEGILKTIEWFQENAKK